MRKIEYFARLDKAKDPGIYKKLSHTVAAFEKKGFHASLILCDGVGGVRRAVPSAIKFFTQILLSKAHIIIIRNDLVMSVLCFAVVIQRLRGTKVVVDIPTPLTNYVREIHIDDTMPLMSRWQRILMIHLIYPWVLMPANAVLQYAPESKYFSFGVARKSMLIANGIDLSGIPQRTNDHKDTVDCRLVLIGVARLSEWHGYDRVIRGIAEHRAITGQSDNVYFHVVGDGPVKSQLKALATKLGVQQFVQFLGDQRGEALTDLYESAHIGVGSLGLYRVGLNAASSLKSREYVARGLPFLNAGYDMDFDPTPEFVYQVENDERPLKLQEIISWYKLLKQRPQLSAEMREYANKTLSFDSKVDSLLLKIAG